MLLHMEFIMNSNVFLHAIIQGYTHLQVKQPVRFSLEAAMQRLSFALYIFIEE